MGEDLLEALKIASTGQLLILRSLYHVKCLFLAKITLKVQLLGFLEWLI